MKDRAETDAETDDETDAEVDANPNFRCVRCSCDLACWVLDSALTEVPAEPRLPILPVIL